MLYSAFEGYFILGICSFILLDKMPLILLFLQQTTLLISSNALQGVLQHSSLQIVELEIEGTAIHGAHESMSVLRCCSEWTNVVELGVLKHLPLCLVFC